MGGHSFRESHAMGTTQLSPAEVQALLQRLTRDWPGQEYDLFEHNSGHFSDALCQELGVGHIRASVTKLADVGATARQRIRAMIYGGSGAQQPPHSSTPHLSRG